MAPPSITTCSSTLMHASLAYLSHEVITMDSIIRGHSATLAPITKTYLPTELLIFIRADLFSIIAEQLVAESAAALLEYEDALRELLCVDCAEYNQDIYGPDVWQWEHFSGPCMCVMGKYKTQQSHRRRRSDMFPPNPKQFFNSQHWLEARMSRVALRFRHNQRRSSSGFIWDIVAEVLREYGCEIAHLSDGSAAPSNGQGRGPMTAIGWSRVGLDRDHVRISVTIPEDRRSRDSWITQAILLRANRELGLGQRYPDLFHRTRSPTVDMSILCFYSKPKSLRMI
ncbi:hypothetical protein K443DRAFT_119708 [Laccaria amethystina LaAM-08-1]|uniref:Uncharacterized protein n=1 Tax=Laccaria amethystina LaAM-08-1 TaxID=1095629 RepID=A0A0C9X551_9AGAR|nr:hypothetical protein K443DRAFT_119708 [Laccaria amethystina LaAM-08-1]